MVSKHQAASFGIGFLFSPPTIDYPPKGDRLDRACSANYPRLIASHERKPRPNRMQLAASNTLNAPEESWLFLFANR